MNAMSHAKKRVLIVDDFSIIRKIHNKNLCKLGFIKIDECESGDEAIQSVSQKEYDLIIMDWYMPGMDGKEAVTVLRSKGYKMPIIMCTDETDRQSIQSIMNLGANAYISKPYSPDQFSQIVTEIMK